MALLLRHLLEHDPHTHGDGYRTHGGEPVSIKLMERVWETTLPTAEKMVLLVIADHANANGTNSWPGVETIARKSSMTPRSVQRHIRNLEERGLIVTKRQQGGNENTRSDRRPNRYDIILTALDGVTIVRSEQDGVTNETERGDIQDSTGRQMEQNGVTPVSPYPSLEPSLEPSKNPDALFAIEADEKKDELLETVTFEQFYEIYPRKASRSDAQRAWDKLKPDQKQLAMDALPIHIAYWDRERTEKDFIPFPASWLNKKRWEDEIAPAKPKNYEPWEV
jgi:DNA-binding transcriptional ArsR family regulator